MTFDPTKPVQTRDGRKARIICTDADNHNCPIVALVECYAGGQAPAVFTTSGRMENVSCETSGDLINIPEEPKTIEGWVNLYPQYHDRLFPTKEDAKKYRLHTCIACVPVTVQYRPGEGLEDE